MLGGALGELMVSEGRVPGLLAWGGRVWLHNKLSCIIIPKLANKINFQPFNKVANHVDE